MILILTQKVTSNVNFCVIFHLKRNLNTIDIMMYRIQWKKNISCYENILLMSQFVSQFAHFCAFKTYLAATIFLAPHVQVVSKKWISLPRNNYIIVEESTTKLLINVLLNIRLLQTQPI